MMSGEVCIFICIENFFFVVNFVCLGIMSGKSNIVEVSIIFLIKLVLLCRF